MMPGMLVTCCCFTLLQTSPKRRRHPKVYSLKKGSDSENPPVCPACVVLLCHSVQNKSETGTPRQGLESFGCSAFLLVFHPKPFKPFMQNHHFSIFAIKKNPTKTNAVAQSRTQEAGTWRLRPQSRARSRFSSSPTMQLFSASTYRGRCN